MKKILLTILAFIYFITSVRATVYLHDCVDIFTNSFSETHSDQKNKLPCKNDPGQCKLETGHRISDAAIKSSRVLSHVLTPAFLNYELENSQVQAHTYSIVYSVLQIHKVSLIILHRVFRI